MTNNVIRISVAILLVYFFIVQASIGQEVKREESRFGLGATFFFMNTFDYFRDHESLNEIYIIYEVNSKFRLEPAIGFEIIPHEKNKYYFGIGAYRKKHLPNFNVLYGLKLGLTDRKGKSIAASVGGEYFFSKNFSLGSELQFKCLNFLDDWIVSTYSPIFVRFYF